MKWPTGDVVLLQLSRDLPSDFVTLLCESKDSGSEQGHTVLNHPYTERNLLCWFWNCAGQRQVVIYRLGRTVVGGGGGGRIIPAGEKERRGSQRKIRWPTLTKGEPGRWEWLHPISARLGEWQLAHILCKMRSLPVSNMRAYHCPITAHVSYPISALLKSYWMSTE